MADQSSREMAQRRKEIRDSCESIINWMEKEQQKRITDLRARLADAKLGGANTRSKTNDLAYTIWREIAFNKVSKLFNVILDDELHLFKHFMTIKDEKWAIDSAELPVTALSFCIGKYYYHEPLDYAEMLLDAGANPNFQGPHGYTPILGLIDQASVGEQHTQFYQQRMALLLRHGADPAQKLRIPAKISSVEMKAGMTPIMVCEKLLKDARKNELSDHGATCLEAVKALMVAKAEDKELGDIVKVAGHDKQGEVKKYKRI